MAEISAGLVKELRELTGLGMMECKKALTECDGDLRKAEELLRIKSGAKASKAASRVAAEGVIGIWVSADAKIGALVELNCETDFVAKNDDFLAFAQSLAEVVATRAPGDTEELGSIDLLGSKIEAKRQGLVQKIGENITIRRCRRLQAKGRLAQYLHATKKIGVLVDFEGADEIGKGLAMHTAFYRPQYLSKANVPADVVAREREIQQARAKESGKPAEIAAKMVEGAVNKYLAEITLLGQPYVLNDKESVEKMLAGQKAKVHDYAVLVVGEGIEKPGASVH
ncbi:MAG TPA: translation elongation factor Ts [Burkholderiales bacterium]|jgi:elongation factor Ts